MVVGLVAASHVTANVFAADGRDPRRIQSRSGDAHAFAAIGVIRNNSPVASFDDDDRLVSARGEATAFMVSPCYAVTNYHAVFGEDTGPSQRDSDRSVTLRIGERRDDRGFKFTIRAVPVFWGDFSEDSEGEDWTVLRLDRCVGPDVGWLSLVTPPPAALNSASFSIAGYPADKDPSVLWRADGCRLHARLREVDLWSSDCAATPGASGSPVFVIENDTPRIVGVMEGAEDNRRGVQQQYSPGLANLVVDVGSILKRRDVTAAIEADIKSSAALPN
jgi:V8-like Glu-specific endopeptidase